MAENIERFNSVASLNSVVRSTTLQQYVDSDDTDKPFTLGEWLVNVNEKLGSPDDYISGHISYIREWYNKKRTVSVSVSKQIVNNYVRFLKELLVVFPTNEEYRYISNLDWESQYDLDIAVPYYADRLREVVLYIVDQRERIRFQKVKNSIRGSVFGTEKLVYDEIITLLSSESYSKMFGSRLPDIKTVAKDLNVTVDEVYDDTQNYNNVFIDGISLSGAREIDSLIFTDFAKAVSQLLSEFPVTLTEQDQDLILGSGLQLQPTGDTSSARLSVLTPEYFANYTNSVDNLNLHNTKKWYSKYIGTDMYYLSSDSDGRYVFDKFITSTTKAENHLNVNTPSVVYEPSNSYVTSRKIGGMFIKTGISHAYSVDTTYRIDHTNISPNAYHTIPDPNIYYSNEPWLIFEESHEWMKADRSNDKLHGQIIGTDKMQSMYPYQSMSETNKYPKFGVSRVTDRFDFWSGDERDVWANADVYKVLKPLDYVAPREQKIHDLLMNQGSVVNWETDIHGNEYALYKQLNDRKQYTEHSTTGTLQCKVLDGEFFWDKVTWEFPNYDTFVDGTSSFTGWELSGYNSYAYGGYFTPYDCGSYDCFCPCEEYTYE